MRRGHGRGLQSVKKRNLVFGGGGGGGGGDVKDKKVGHFHLD